MLSSKTSCESGSRPVWTNELIRGQRSERELARKRKQRIPYHYDQLFAWSGHLFAFQGERVADEQVGTERLVLCIQANRMSRICIEDAYEYACSRKTFGKALITQPLIRDKVRSDDPSR